MLQRKTDTEKIETNDETQGEAEQINCNERKLFNNLNTDDSLNGGQDSNSNEIKSEPDVIDTEGLKFPLVYGGPRSRVCARETLRSH